MNLSEVECVQFLRLHFRGICFKSLQSVPESHFLSLKKPNNPHPIKPESEIINQNNQVKTLKVHVGK